MPYVSAVQWHGQEIKALVLWAPSLSQGAVVTVCYTTILFLVIRDGGIELPRYLHVISDM